MLDRNILQYINSLSQPWLDTFFLFVTFGGSISFLLPLSVVIAVVTALHRQWRSFFFVVVGMAGAALLNVAIKELVARARPDLWESPVFETTYSFPSGHAMSTMAFAVIAAYLVHWYVRQRRVRWLLFGVLAVFVTLVGLSRLYLGVHYPSDVVAGWILGALFVIGVRYLTRLFRPNGGS